MFAPVDDEALKLSPLTLSVKEVTTESSNPATDGKTLDERFDGYGHSALSTPTSAHTTSGFSTDLEGMKHVQSSDHLRGASVSGERFDSDSSVWPGQAHWREKDRAAKRKNRSCHWLARLSKRTQIIVKVAIVLSVVGVAVGVGFGISKSLGARVWQPEDDRR
ncbi:hypothetical protein SAMD00023353_0902740 [Rosellinia necatrix]|uniref:Uncharacterized protein n=1 Tax=Rosellinia necatrix TaxID=77044 RepID=A0A1W2TL97_ROSNE|nr:hypothetical protein SAMD00023353_0902740 [Rosellinia necatrix]